MIRISGDRLIILYRSDQAARKLESVRSAAVPIIRFVSQPRALEDAPRYVLEEEGVDVARRPPGKRGKSPAGSKPAQ